MAIPLVSRYNGRIVANFDCRFSRLHMKSIDFIAGETVEIGWMATYNAPHWQPIPGSRIHVTIKQSGVLEFSIILGQHLKSGPLPDTCRLLFPPPPEHRPLPVLSYYVIMPNKSVKSGRMDVDQFWHQAAYHSGLSAIASIDQEFIQIDHVVEILQTTWTRKFSYLPAEQIPRLTRGFVRRLASVATNVGDSDLAVVSRRDFHGDVSAKDASIWRLFQNTLELVGRSFILRALFNSKQLIIANARDMMGIDPSYWADNEDPSFLCFFRIPRSLTPSVALVCELWSIDRSSDDHVSIERILPMPYITVAQLESAKGDPFKAFAQLESAHHHLLQSISIRNLVQPPHIKFRHYPHDTLFQSLPLDLPSDTWTRSTNIDEQWLTRSYLSEKTEKGKEE